LFNGSSFLTAKMRSNIVGHELKWCMYSVAALVNDDNCDNLISYRAADTTVQG
jgi:hypothetical protein